MCRIVVIGVVALVLSACSSGPQLRVQNAQVSGFDGPAGQVNWTAEVVNVDQAVERCTTISADGWIKIQAWLLESTTSWLYDSDGQYLDLADLSPRRPLGGALVVADGEQLAIGDSRSWSNQVTGQEDLSNYTHLVIEAYTKKAGRDFPLPGDPTVNSSCARYYTRVVLPLP